MNTLSATLTIASLAKSSTAAEIASLKVVSVGSLTTFEPPSHGGVAVSPGTGCGHGGVAVSPAKELPANANTNVRVSAKFLMCFMVSLVEGFFSFSCAKAQPELVEAVDDAACALYYQSVCCYARFLSLKKKGRSQMNLTA